MDEIQFVIEFSVGGREQKWGEGEHFSDHVSPQITLDEGSYFLIRVVPRAVRVNFFVDSNRRWNFSLVLEDRRYTLGSVYSLAMGRRKCCINSSDEAKQKWAETYNKAFILHFEKRLY